MGELNKMYNYTVDEALNAFNNAGGSAMSLWDVIEDNEGNNIQ